ncbi:hypothetical protein BDA99DRAFT_306338 [Phascolomyces articulosus]|uniref:F-box domain-containing protein n=1 Tax=Phascolomyces articulosus TaxID=60185 RepID=A0AAD5K6R6_9FUNG|nr:hypothetical protein BDA99DRAFT_306338 [Phascolomyces articulosus]
MEKLQCILLINRVTIHVMYYLRFTNNRYNYNYNNNSNNTIFSFFLSSSFHRIIVLSSTMSFFKQAHDPVLSTVSDKQKDEEASSFPKKPINFLAFTFAGTKNRKAQQQKAAQKMIKKSPTSAKGYFISAQLYQEQDDFNSALNIYLHGLKSVPLDDPYHSSLLNEKQKLLVKIKQRSQGGFYNLLPYDLLYLIFGYLDYKDLLQCARVCRRWNDFMMDWPEFWNKLKLGMPNLHQSTLLSLLHGGTQELRLEGPLDPGLKCDIFWLLSSWEDNHFIQKICKYTVI